MNLTLDELADLIFVSDDSEGVLDYSFAGRVGLIPYGADFTRGGGIRMPPGLIQGKDAGRGTTDDDEQRRRSRIGITGK